MSSANDFVIENGVLTKYRGRGGVVVIPEGVETIKDSVFQGWEIITELTIPASVKSIGLLALYGCSGLERITMTVDLLRSCDSWECVFGGTGKTVEVLLLEEGKEPYLAVAAFRKGRTSQDWAYEEDYLVPLTEENRRDYDRFIATGEFAGFRMNEQGRLKAMVWRLAETDRPIAEEYRSLFLETLVSKFSKLVKLQDPSLVRDALAAGIVTDSTRKKITNALKKSAMPGIRDLAVQLG